MLDDLDETSRSLFLVRITNGEELLTVVGGDLDGLRYFKTDIDGVVYRITDRGLFDPPKDDA